MGKVYLFTPEQKIILDEIESDEFLRSRFYFTGGTALSYLYLRHRHSEDLDFFSEKPFEALDILNRITKWSKKHKFSVELQENNNINIFNLTFPKQQHLKVDFVHHQYKRVAKGSLFNHIEIDSLRDIAINKLLTTNQRTQIKDFVDLYFLLKEFTVWD